MNDAAALKAEILRLTRAYSELVHGANRPATDPGEHAPRFEPGRTTVPYGGRVFDPDEVEAAVGSTLDFWLTLGAEGEAFERELAGILGTKRTLNARPEGLAAAYAPSKTKAVMMAYTLGNPFDLAAVTAFCREHDLWLVEDNCDALGSTYRLPGGGPANAPRFTGTFGDLSTQSFLSLAPPDPGRRRGRQRRARHEAQAARGELPRLGPRLLVRQRRGQHLRQAFRLAVGQVARGYDHKYIYSHLGYNLKPLEIQAAIGRQQFKKLPDFSAALADLGGHAEVPTSDPRDGLAGRRKALRGIISARRRTRTGSVSCCWSARARSSPGWNWPDI